MFGEEGAGQDGPNREAGCNMLGKKLCRGEADRNEIVHLAELYLDNQYIRYYISSTYRLLL